MPEARPIAPCIRRARLLHAAGARACAPCKHAHLTSAYTLVCSMQAGLLNVCSKQARLLKAGWSAQCRPVCSMQARLLDASPPVCPSAPTCYAQQTRPSAQSRRRARLLHATSAPVCSMQQACPSARRARLLHACARVCCMQARLLNASARVSSSAGATAQARARTYVAVQRASAAPPGSMQARLLNASPSAQCRPVCSMQARLPNATTSAQRNHVCSTQPRLPKAKPVCSKQDRLSNATPSAPWTMTAFGPTAFGPDRFLARAPLTIQYVKTRTPNPKPKLERRGRHETLTVVRGVGRAVSELPQYQLKPPTKAPCMGGPEEACPHAAECFFAWLELE